MAGEIESVCCDHTLADVQTYEAVDPPELICEARRNTGERDCKAQREREPLWRLSEGC